MPDTKQPEGSKGFDNGLWTAGTEVDSPSESVSDILDFDIEEDGGLALRGGIAPFSSSSDSKIGYYTNSAVATISAGGLQVDIPATDLVVLAAVTNATGNNVWFWRSVKGNSQINTISVSGGNTTLILLTVVGTGTTTNWDVSFLGAARGVHRHYNPSDSTDRCTLVAGGKFIWRNSGAGTSTFLSTTQTGDLDTHMLTVGGKTYIDNGTDLPLVYDTTSGLRGTGGSGVPVLTAPAKPLFALSASAPIGQGAQTLATAQTLAYRTARTIAGQATGGYGGLSAPQANFSQRGNASLLVSAAKSYSRYADALSVAYTGDTPYFWSPDLAISTSSSNDGLHVTPTFSFNSASTTVTLSNANTLGNVSAGQVVYCYGLRDPFHYIISVNSGAGTFVIDRNPSDTYVATWQTDVFVTGAVGAGNVALGGTAFSDGSSITFGSAQAATPNAGDLVISFFNANYDGGAISGNSVSDGTDTNAINVHHFTSAATNWATFSPADYAYRGSVYSMWEVSPNNGTTWYSIVGSAANAITGSAPITATRVYFWASNATPIVPSSNLLFRHQPGSTGTNSLGLAVNGAGNGNFKWRIGVVKSAQSSTVWNLYAHNGAFPGGIATQWAYIAGYPARAAKYGIELFKTNSNVSSTVSYETTTFLGQNGVSGIAGVCVADLKADTWITAVAASVNLPPIYKFGLEYQQAAIWLNVKERDGSAAYPSQLRYSNPSNPDSTTGDKFYNIGRDGRDGSLVGGFVLYNTLYLLKDNALWALYGNLYSSPQITLIDGHIGCSNWKTIQVGFNECYWLGPDAVYRFNSQRATPISRPIADTIRSMSVAQKQAASATWREKRYWLTFTDPTGDESLTKTFIYDPVKDNWTKHGYGAWSWFEGDTFHDSKELFFTRRTTADVHAAMGGQFIMKADLANQPYDILNGNVAIAPYVVSRRFLGGDALSMRKIFSRADIVFMTQKTGTCGFDILVESGDGSFVNVVSSG